MPGPMVQREWFSAGELASLGLPGLSSAKRKINERAAAEGWALRAGADGQPLARTRAGRGGGTEYHVSLFPAKARAELVRRGLTADEADPGRAGPDDAAGLWAWFGRQPRAIAAEAQRRLEAVQAIEAMEAQGHARTVAIATVARALDLNPSTLWRWLDLVATCAAADRLPHLAPRRMGGGSPATIEPDMWQLFKSDWLRPEKPTIASCYRRVQAAAAARGIAIPSLKAFQRRLEREVPAAVVTARRTGTEAVRQLLPPQIRTVAQMSAMELVNIDGHRWDVFVRWPARAGEPERIARPVMVAIQDVYSRKILAWRVGETESAVLTRLAFADLFARWGIPEAVLLDNGRAFASKWITGGAKTRFRFRIRDDEPLGLLTQLNIRNHWATPYRGQSKPIERAFRDFCDAISRHPAFAGAWAGNKVEAKPENYQSNAIDLDLFLKIVGMGIAEHNARPGRRTETAAGRSFDETFAESYATAGVGRATAEQLRMALLAADRVRADRRTGAITFLGNRYWCEALGRVAGQLLTIRFDPENLHSEIHVEDARGQFVATAPIWEATGFLDAEAARRRAKLESDHRRRTRELLELEQLLSAEQVAALLPADADEAPVPAPGAIRPVRLRTSAAAAIAVPDRQPVRAQSPFIDRFAGAVTRLRLVE
ncbi:MAG: transposase domain-containing protein [Sphingomonadaceae bacterium]